MPRLPTPTDFPPSLHLDIIPPPNNSPPINILLLLHGLGDTKAPFTTLARSLNLPETACLAIQGLHPIPQIFLDSEPSTGVASSGVASSGVASSAFHWGDDVLIDEGKGEIEMDSGFEKTREVLGSVVRMLMEGCGFPARNILFYGFGQGGMAALCLISSSSSPNPPPPLSTLEFGGVISIGGRLPSSSTSSSAKCKTPILVCGGSNSTQITRQAIDGLKERFGTVEYVRWEKRGDSMPGSREEMLPLMRFFARRLRSRVGVPEGAVEV
ncbi:hypothetical protein HYFRA_00006328 [Hymenoscyphus fraxineus]|uniref:Phospholipase/carboxylesterase/thioesterase domain-containing protein n=1 Tax=Hymenoscyphus fraxineus TaxID=746836 RepID=A0A9N9LCN3_9HELO|nr:hypothetical protein HYFRA_00006328 [Hymenoscyphus fraxineus]